MSNINNRLRYNHKTKNGYYYIGDSLELLSKGALFKKLKGKVQLIFTSPPFPLNNKKKYGNLEGEEYRKWFVSLAEIFSNLLTRAVLKRISTYLLKYCVEKDDKRE